jgi:repressor LexA
MSRGSGVEICGEKQRPAQGAGTTSHTSFTKGSAMPDLTKLTDRQREIYDFIKEKIESRGFGPTVREIGDAFDIKSPNGVMCHLKALVTKGIIQRTDRRARAIQLVGHRRPGIELPLLGLVAAGAPLSALPQEDRLSFNELFGGADNFALKVKGQSMIEDHIDDGDYVVIHKQETAENGERVVAMIDNEVTLKRFHREKGQVRLEPANGKMQPIVLDPNSDNKILGVLVGVLRKC